MLPSYRPLAVLAAWAAWASAAPASGAQITFVFTGTVEAVDGPSDALDALDAIGVEPGVSASGSLTFAAETPDQQPDDDSIGDYPGAVVALSAQIAGYQLTLDPSALPEEDGVVISTRDINPDSVSFYASVLDEPDLSLPGFQWTTFVLSWTGPDGRLVLPDDSLPTTPPDLGVFSASAEMAGFTVCEPPAACHAYVIQLTITSVAGIPEPASGALLGLGLLGVGIARRAGGRLFA